MTTIKIFPRTGAFAENKDVARDIRMKEILPALGAGQDVILDFSQVDAATQSFIHALISDLIRKQGSGVLEHLEFRSCNETVRKLVTIVVDYMQEGT